MRVPPPAPRRRDAAAGIEDAALELFVREPFESVTATAIAHAAGVSVRTYYRNFTGKEQILTSLPMCRARSFAAAAGRRPAQEPPFAAVRAGIAELASTDDPTCGDGSVPWPAGTAAPTISLGWPPRCSAMLLISSLNAGMSHALETSVNMVPDIRVLTRTLGPKDSATPSLIESSRPSRRRTGRSHAASGSNPTS